MPKMRVTQADGTVKIVEDTTFKNKRIVPKFSQHQPRALTLEKILKALKLNDGQTLDELEISTEIPAYFLGKYLLELEKQKQVVRSGPRHYLQEAPSTSLSLT